MKDIPSITSFSDKSTVKPMFLSCSTKESNVSQNKPTYLGKIVLLATSEPTPRKVESSLHNLYCPFSLICKVYRPRVDKQFSIRTRLKSSVALLFRNSSLLDSFSSAIAFRTSCSVFFITAILGISTFSNSIVGKINSLAVETI